MKEALKYQLLNPEGFLKLLAYNVYLPFVYLRTHARVCA